jgi:hypothetical protein
MSALCHERTFANDLGGDYFEFLRALSTAAAQAFRMATSINSFLSLAAPLRASDRLRGQVPRLDLRDAPFR